METEKEWKKRKLLFIRSNQKRRRKRESGGHKTKTKKGLEPDEKSCGRNFTFVVLDIDIDIDKIYFSKGI